jgi:tetratricopeptide (TPR) repeat protein
MPTSREANLRYAKYYLELIWRTSQLYELGDIALRQGLALFDAELPHFRRAQKWVSKASGDDTKATALCSHYPDAGVYVINLRLHPHERIRWQTAALNASRQLDDRSAEMTHLSNLGLSYFDLGDASRAAEHHKQALAIGHELGDPRGEGSALCNLGMCQQVLGNPRRAIGLYTQSLALSKKIGDKGGECTALGNLGLAYADLGESRRAIECHTQGLKIARTIGNLRMEGRALGNLGLSHAALGEYQFAINY